MRLVFDGKGQNYDQLCQVKGGQNFWGVLTKVPYFFFRQSLFLHSLEKIELVGKNAGLAFEFELVSTV